MSVEIKISKLLASFPTVGYIDRINLPVESRPVRVGRYVEKFLTDDKFTTIAGHPAEKQMIRAVAWDKYKCKLMVHEGQGFENIDIAGDVTIKLDGITHNVNILDFGEPVFDEGSAYHTFEFTYYDTNPVNYLAVPVNDFLTIDAVSKLYPTMSLNFLKVGLKKYYTALNHKVIFSKFNQEGEKVNGIDVTFQSNYQKAIAIRIYCNESQAVILSEQLPQPANIFYHTGQLTFNSVERMLPKITEIDDDLFQVEIELKYQNQTVNHF